MASSRHRFLAEMWRAISSMERGQIVIVVMPDGKMVGQQVSGSTPRHLVAMPDASVRQRSSTSTVLPDFSAQAGVVTVTFKADVVPGAKGPSRRQADRDIV